MLHCALASGAVYCNRSCLCVCVFMAGGRCPNLTTASARSVCVSLNAFSFACALAERSPEVVGSADFDEI